MGAGDVRIRRMTVDDFAEVYGLGRACWRPVDVPYNWWSLAEVADHLQNHPRLCHVAEADGRVVGFILGATTFELDPDTGHLEWLAVDPDYRRAGVATRLLEAALAVYQELGRRSVAADIAAGNEASQELVRRLGFVESVSVTFFTKELGPSQEA